MGSDDEILEATACCLVILRRYRDGEGTGVVKARIVVEIEMIIDRLRQLALFTDLTRQFLQSLVKEDLLGRHVAKVGRKFDGEFTETFSGIGRINFFQF